VGPAVAVANNDAQSVMLVELKLRAWEPIETFPADKTVLVYIAPVPAGGGTDGSGWII
jgi:hypothetical protein